MSYGEIELLGDDVGGVAVHIGARVGALAGPSEVLVNFTVKDLVAGSGLVFEDRGEHHLKGIPDAWRLTRPARGRASTPGSRPAPADTRGGTMGGMDPVDLKALERTPLFQSLPRGHRKKVALLATVDQYHDGEVIVRAGEPGACSSSC